jgi:hypothetical protein
MTPPSDAVSAESVCLVPLNEPLPAAATHPCWTREDRYLVTLLFNPGKASPFLRRTGDRPGCQGPDWGRLFTLAEREGVTPVLFHTITETGLEDRVPLASYRKLSDHYHATLRRNLSLIGRLRPVLAAFRENGIACIVLKGIALAEKVYPSVGMRGMSDIDLLLGKEDLSSADALLACLGYHPADSSVAKALCNPSGYLSSLEYRKPGQPFSLHIHWHIVNTSVPATALAARIDIERLRQCAIPIQVADSRAFMLRPEHQVISLCEHALRVGHSFDRLILLCDLFFLLKRCGMAIDWGFLLAESRRFNLTRFVYLSLRIVAHYTGMAPSEAHLHSLCPSSLSWGERLFLRLQFSNRRIRGSSYLVHLAMAGGLRRRIGFLFRTLFPPRQILRQRQYFQEPGGMAPLYLSHLRETFTPLQEAWRARRR